MQHRLSAGIGLSAIMLCVFTHAAGPVPTFTVTGNGQGADGSRFAILRDVGVVREGEVVPFRVPGWTGRLRVVSVSPDRVKVEVLDSAVAKEPVKAQVSEPDAWRDPFAPPVLEE